MRLFAGALLFVGFPAMADEMPLSRPVMVEEVIVSDAVQYRPKRTTVSRVVCVKCRSAGLPWGGLRPVRRVELPWGGLAEYCPPVAVSRRQVVVVTKG